MYVCYKWYSDSFKCSFRAMSSSIHVVTIHNVVTVGVGQVQLHAGAFEGVLGTNIYTVGARCQIKPVIQPGIC